MNENIIIYLKSELYSVVYNKETHTFFLVDRNVERISDKNFDIPAGAIEFAEVFYKGLC